MGQSSHVHITVASLFKTLVNYGLRYFEQESEISSKTATGWHTDCSQVSQAALFAISSSILR